MDLQSHGTEDQLEQYALGRLPDSDLPAFEEHLLMCALCQERLDEACDFAVGMQEALAADAFPVPPAGFFNFDWLRRPVFPLALACAALVLIVAVYSSGVLAGRLNGRTKFVPAAALQLTAMRGEMPFSLPAKQIHLTLMDAPQTGAPFHVQVVDATGKAEWNGLVSPATGVAQVDIQKALSPGDYFVRLNDSDGKLVHEYGFRVRE